MFAGGFYSYLRGDIGERVGATPDQLKPVATQSANIVPLILGDSLARGTGDASGLGIGGRVVQDLRARKVPVQNIVNLGINGARTADLLDQLDHRNVQVLIGQANAIIVSIGGNDLRPSALTAGGGASAPLSGAPPSEIIGRVVGVVERVRKINPNARIYVIGLYNPYVGTPMGKMASMMIGRWNAKLVDQFATDANVSVVQTADIFQWHDRLSFDRFHPNAEGYELIARRIADTF